MRYLIIFVLLLSGCGGNRSTPIITPPIPPPPPVQDYIPDYIIQQFPDVKKVKSEIGWDLYYTGEINPQDLLDAFDLAYSKVTDKAGKNPDQIALVYIYIKPNCQNLNGKWGLCVEPIASDPFCVDYMKEHYPWSITPDGRCVVNGYTDVYSIPIRIYISTEMPDPRHETVHAIWFALFPAVMCPAPLGTIMPQYSVTEHGFACDPFLVQ